MMSASLSKRARLICMDCTPSCGSTRRSVTGNRGVPFGPSANRSTMPNVPAANLASGGMGEVRTVSGKLAALASGRPLSSFKSAGSVSV